LLEGRGEVIGGYCEAQQLVGQVKARYYWAEMGDKLTTMKSLGNKQRKMRRGE